ncbi:uncharacterized protein LOC135924878 [Gordionus sp. m RMFG-2023]|uniref:uncharacterized protein LOC135924878 n=1 Tax=Gordionus sp. m RMFG-2023 TaxID=3053472 RepID=UPI0031FC15E1
MEVPILEMFEEVAKGFEEMWNFPNCIGAIDGKQTKRPPHSGTQFYNYKHKFSLILQAFVDHMGKFMVIDVGSYGSQSDGGVFANSLLSQRIERNELPIPPPKLLPNSNILVPHVILGEGGYPLKRYLMKPYIRNNDDNNKIFNYRLSRARRVVECSFGVLTSKWRILLNKVEVSLPVFENIIKACCILHNIILIKENINVTNYDPVGSNHPIWNQQNNLNDTYSQFLDLNKLETELKVVFRDDEFGKKKNVNEILEFLICTNLMKSFNEFLKLCKFIFTLASTTASAERSFSSL